MLRWSIALRDRSSSASGPLLCHRARLLPVAQGRMKTAHKTLEMKDKEGLGEHSMAGERDAAAKGNGWVIDWYRKAGEDQGSQLASPGSTGMHHLAHLKAHLPLHTTTPMPIGDIA